MKEKLRMTNQLKLIDFVPEGKFFHFAYVTFPKPRAQVPHCHDFVEIFFASKGPASITAMAGR